MRVRIHRGAAEIGGNCIEVESAGGERIVLDLGRPLSAGFDDVLELPAVSGLRHHDDSYLIDHSAFDAYSLLVEAEGERLFYTGDFRGHGREAPPFEDLLADPLRLTEASA